MILFFVFKSSVASLPELLFVALN